MPATPIPFKAPSKQPAISPFPSPIPTTDYNADKPYPSTNSEPLRMSYRIARGEQGVLTFEPYKSALLPLWRFKTVPIAETSSSQLWNKFLDYDAHDDFVGMDMTRKFIQMGMTRARRYANYKGGRKYVVSEKDGGGRGKSKQVERSEGHEGQEEKMRASEIFRGVWERCKEHEGYGEKKERFLKELMAWEQEQKTDEKKQRASKGSVNAATAGRKRKRKTEDDESDGSDEDG